jgi:hypothetical protein
MAKIQSVVELQAQMVKHHIITQVGSLADQDKGEVTLGTAWYTTTKALRLQVLIIFTVSTLAL